MIKINSGNKLKKKHLQDERTGKRGIDKGTDLAPAALLAEPLFMTPNCNLCGFRVELTDFMATVIVPTFTEVRFAPINQA